MKWVDLHSAIIAVRLQRQLRLLNLQQQRLRQQHPLRLLRHHLVMNLHHFNVGMNTTMAFGVVSGRLIEMTAASVIALAPQAYRQNGVLKIPKIQLTVNALISELSAVSRFVTIIRLALTALA